MSNPLRLAFRPFALLYEAIVQTRNQLFNRAVLRAWESPMPVVSVGNLSAGGTGKTPMVDWVVKYYLSIGFKPAIISRGYKRQSKGVQLVSDGNNVLLSSREAGDETAMLAWNNPDAIVVVASKRKQGVKLITKRFAQRLPSVIILDDAFQHRQIARSLDIVLVNAEEPFVEAAMLPEGRLREPKKNLLRADVVVLNKITDLEAATPSIKALEEMGRPLVKARLSTGELICFSGDATTLDEPATAHHLNAFAFAGIAKPESFVTSLQHEGVNVGATRFVRDHAPYSAKMLRAIRRQAEEQGLCLITTEKDYFRLLGQPELLSIITALPCYYLKIAPDIFDGKALLQEKLNAVVHYVPKPEPPKKIEEPYRRW
uniref:Tetraacyldisaccharide 4'-kinase n=1 Tax=Chlorobium chlorochromatii (strain CaD3) TaxID=340177 RepID=LPXK_CHLCH|nr:RecName: Full=Tetraacyldisaccharide 4'-kinase; AltName: Full=Lipid A 4'-kinase [Chlorobium chlorochromatii CaD3]